MRAKIPEELTAKRIGGYITVYPHHWGWGKDAKAARVQAKFVGGRGDSWVTYLLPVNSYEAYVKWDGSINWTWLGAPKDQPTTERVAEGWLYKKTRLERARKEMVG